MTDAGRGAHNRQRNQLSESNQAAGSLTHEKSGHEQEQADLETTAIDHSQQSLDHHAGEFAGVCQLSAAQNPKNCGSDRGAKENGSAQPQAQE